MPKNEETAEDKAEKDLRAAKAAAAKARRETGSFRAALVEIRELTAHPGPQVASEVFRIAEEALK